MKKLTSGFRTRKELGLKPNEIPFKFRVEIDAEHDGETEIARKRALLRLNSQRIYMQMSSSVQAYQGQRQVLRWLGVLTENLDEAGREAVAPHIMACQDLLLRLDTLSQEKIKQAVDMEEVLTEARTKARQARLRLTKLRIEKSRKQAEFGIFSLAVSEDGPDLPKVPFLESFDPSVRPAFPFSGPASPATRS